MEILIGKIGVIKKGENLGWYLLVEDDTQNTGGYYIYTCISQNFDIAPIYDNWVDKVEYIKDIFDSYKWEVEWHAPTGASLWLVPI